MKTINCAVVVTLMGSSVSGWAQQSQPQGQNQNVANGQKPNGQAPVGAAATSPVNQVSQGDQPVATNPFGSVKPSQNAPEINYNAGANNINGNKQVIVPTGINNAQVIPNPAVAQQQTMGTPVQPPAGLPPEYTVQTTQVQNHRNASSIDATEATITILNTPNQKIRELNKDLYNKGRVINEGPVSAPRSNNGVIVAHLSPGSTSPVVRLFKNRTSTIIITDVTGQPWPIINYDGLSDEDFVVKRLDNPAPDGYVLSITPKGAFVSGNLALILKGLPTPLNIEFVSAQKEVDVSTEVRVQAKGPNTQYTSIGLPAGLDTSLLSVLQGVAPNGAKELKVSSQAVQAWLAKDGSMYVRTRYKIMSPAFENVTSSPDGTYAYKMVPVPVVLFKVADGRFGEFSVEGF